MNAFLTLSYPAYTFTYTYTYAYTYTLCFSHPTYTCTHLPLVPPFCVFFDTGGRTIVPVSGASNSSFPADILATNIVRYT